ncbi:unnamed protein product, partial [marine sediment metagenome]
LEVDEFIGWFNYLLLIVVAVFTIIYLVVIRL